MAPLTHPKAQGLSLERRRGRRCGQPEILRSVLLSANSFCKPATTRVSRSIPTEPAEALPLQTHLPTAMPVQPQRPSAALSPSRFSLVGAVRLFPPRRPLPRSNVHELPPGPPGQSATPSRSRRHWIEAPVRLPRPADWLPPTLGEPRPAVAASLRSRSLNRRRLNCRGQSIFQRFKLHLELILLYEQRCAACL